MGTELARTCPEIQTMLETHREKIAKVCAQQIDLTRQIQLAVLCCYYTPKLLRCDQGSLLSGVMEASDLGLSLSRSSGEAHLIPRRDKHSGILRAHFQAGYQGLAKLAREAGVRYVHARTVHQYDDFEWGWNPELEFIHRLRRDGRRGQVDLVYAVARLESGDLIGECKTVDEIQQIRMRSQTPHEGPWVTDWNPMAMKTVFRGLAKWLPRTPRLERAIESHDADFDFDAPEELPSLIQTETPAASAAIAANSPAPGPQGPPKKADRLTAQLAARAASLRGVKIQASAPAPIQNPKSKIQNPPVVPTTAGELADFVKQTGTTFFATYGRTRRFPVPMTSWSNDQVYRAWEAFCYERDVTKTMDTEGRWIQEPAINGRTS